MASTSGLSIAELEAEIVVQTAKFNELRLKGEPLDDAKKTLSDLKKSLALAKGAGKEKKEKAEKVEGGDQQVQEKKKKERLLLKTAKGTRDYGPAEMFCREHIDRIIKDTFTTYGGSCLDTPVFERKDVLTDKYGEDAKLIFDLKDQGGEELALRYDHTVPLARYVAMIGGTAPQSKIWQVGKVYRRDNPVMSKGRMREFMQADFDITGHWDPMIPDGEILSMLCTVLSKLDVGEFTIKLNHRKILDGIFEVCGVPAEKIRSISSAVDKLDKLPWAEVKKEMTEEKGLDPAVADKIGEYVKHKGGPELLALLEADELLSSNKSAKQGLSEMSILFGLLKAYKILDKISFDMSLARGLDYYTGIIYEAIVEASAPPGFKDANALAAPPSDAAPPTPAPAPKKKSKSAATAADDEEKEIDESQVGVGSIAAGGRYDGLVGAFLAGAAGVDPNSKEGKKAMGPGGSTPCVGVSIGVDRIFALVWPKWVEKGGRAKGTMVYVMSAGDGLLAERVELVTELRAAGIKSDFLAKSKPKIAAQFAAGEKDEVPFAIILGADELKAGLVTVKEQRWELVDGKKVKIESADKGTQVKRSELLEWIKATSTWKEWNTGIW
ncbi:Histidine--tRNA ligase, mitochondrial [Psilocybe cubensis]|uniref:Histidine--tRNA ligase, mitochondrial n=2 Tax=Psilocybe cubensis TaxID=181762 RepID=A0ACB8HDE2_PSICU|nr:Histidine--tRNA ligase, mitochondrial [Psilocybe cubensis]KAH9486033.1 Histidine--tRNA ligase, mitochondrial [Psilocybe cubensis]